MVSEKFAQFARWATGVMGSAPASLVAALGVFVWVGTGFLFQFNAEWSFWGNDITTVVTFLMVFIIQNTQNRDTKAIHLKLNEVLRALDNAKNEIIAADDMSDAALAEKQAEYKQLSEE